MLFRSRHGTRWRVAAVPLGGYVRFVGDDNIASQPDSDEIEALSPAERDLAFHTKSVGRRAAIVAAGPIANFLLAVVIFTGLVAVTGRLDPTATVGAVVSGSAAEAADLRVGDVIVAMEGEPIASFVDIQRIVAPRADQPTSVVYERDGLRHTVTVTPRPRVVEAKDGPQTRGVLGIQRNTLSVGPIEALETGVSNTWFIAATTGDFLGRLFTGRESLDQVGGPLRVAKMSGEVAEAGFGPLLNMVAFLSVSIGMFNLLPVPVLDGGHLAFYLFEALRGRPVPERVQDVGFRIGLALVLMLMSVVLFNDILVVLWK